MDIGTPNRKRAAPISPVDLSPHTKYRKRSNTEESKDGNRSDSVLVPGELQRLKVMVRFVQKQDGSALGNQLPLGISCINSTQKLTKLVTLFTYKKKADMLGVYDVSVKYGDPNKSFSQYLTLSQFASNWESVLKQIFITLIGLEQCFMWLHIVLHDNLDVCFDPDLTDIIKTEQTLGLQNQKTDVGHKKLAEFGGSFSREAHDTCSEHSFESCNTGPHRTAMKSVKESNAKDSFMDSGSSVGESDCEDSMGCDELRINEGKEVTSTRTTESSVVSSWTDLSIGHGPVQLIEPPTSPTPTRPRQTTPGTHNHRSSFFQNLEKQQRRRASEKRRAEKGAVTRRATIKPRTKHVGGLA